MILEAEADRRIKKAKKLSKLETEAQKMFEHYDADSSGELDRTELESCLRDLFRLMDMPQPTPKDVDEAMGELSEEGKNSVPRDRYEPKGCFTFYRLILP